MILNKKNALLAHLFLVTSFDNLELMMGSEQMFNKYIEKLSIFFVYFSSLLQTLSIHSFRLR